MALTCLAYVPPSVSHHEISAIDLRDPTASLVPPFIRHAVFASSTIPYLRRLKVASYLYPAQLFSNNRIQETEWPRARRTCLEQLNSFISYGTPSKGQSTCLGSTTELPKRLIHSLKQQIISEAHLR